jgi:hypothetical protein
MSLRFRIATFLCRCLGCEVKAPEVKDIPDIQTVIPTVDDLPFGLIMDDMFDDDNIEPKEPTLIDWKQLDADAEAFRNSVW